MHSHVVFVRCVLRQGSSFWAVKLYIYNKWYRAVYIIYIRKERRNVRTEIQYCKEKFLAHVFQKKKIERSRESQEDEFDWIDWQGIFRRNSSTWKMAESINPMVNGFKIGYIKIISIIKLACMVNLEQNRKTRNTCKTSRKTCNNFWLIS